MAAPNLTSVQREHVYRSLARLNHSFTNVLRVLREVESVQTIFRRERLRELRGLAKEFQCEVNHALLGPLQSAEDADWFQFGQVRISREHRLNSERASFKQR